MLAGSPSTRPSQRPLVTSQTLLPILWLSSGWWEDQMGAELRLIWLFPSKISAHMLYQCPQGSHLGPHPLSISREPPVATTTATVTSQGPLAMLLQRTEDWASRAVGWRPVRISWSETKNLNVSPTLPLQSLLASLTSLSYLHSAPQSCLAPPHPWSLPH